MAGCKVIQLPLIDPKKHFALGHDWFYFPEQDSVRKQIFVSENSDSFLFKIKKKGEEFYGVLPFQPNNSSVHSLSSAVLAVAEKKHDSVLVIERIESDEDSEHPDYWMLFIYKGKVIISSEVLGDYVMLSSTLQKIQELIDSAQEPLPEEEVKGEYSSLRYVGSGIADFISDNLGNRIEGLPLKDNIDLKKCQKFRTLDSLRKESLMKFSGVSLVSLLLGAMVYYATPGEEPPPSFSPPTAEELLEARYEAVKPKFAQIKAKAENNVVFGSWVDQIEPLILNTKLVDVSGNWRLDKIGCDTQKCTYHFTSKLETPPKEPLKASYSSICRNVVFESENKAACSRALTGFTRENQVLYKERYVKIYDRLSTFSQKIDGFNFHLSKAKPLFTVDNLSEFLPLMRRDGLYVMYQGEWNVSGRLLNMNALFKELDRAEGFVPSNIGIDLKQKEFVLEGEFYAKD